MMDLHDGAARLIVFLTEDDRSGHRSAADVLSELAGTAELCAASIWPGTEGFGATGHLRAERLPDLARGLPVLFVLEGPLDKLTAFIPLVREIAPGALATLEGLPSR